MSMSSAVQEAINRLLARARTVDDQDRVAVWADDITTVATYALEAVNDLARLLGLIDGIGRIAERRMGICPLCDEHWNSHGMACPVRPALDAPAAVAGEAAVEQDCPSCGESKDKHITICTKDAQMVPIPHNGAAAPAQIHMPARRQP